MKVRLAWAASAILILAAPLLGAQTAPAGAPDPEAALRAADASLYPASYTMRLGVETKRPGKEDSSLLLDVAHKEGKGTFMEILEPARSKGTRFLVAPDSLWMWSPRAGSRSPLRLSPRESFQGSAFSNGDVGESSWAEDYRAGIAGEAAVEVQGLGKVPAWIVEGKALRRDVAYGAIRLWLRKGDLLPLRVEYDAKSGLHVKTMELSDFAVVAGRLRPQSFTMIEEGPGGSRSLVRISELRERNDLPDSMFNQTWLVR